MAAYANLGGLGGLGGMGGVEPEQKPSFLRSDGFGNVLQALGTSLLSSPRNAPLSGFGSALQGFSQNSLEQRKEAEQRAAFEQALIEAGMDPARAKTMAANPQAAKFTLDQQQQKRETEAANTQRNTTLEFLRTADPEIAAMVEAGMPVSDGFKMHMEKRNGKQQGLMNAGDGAIYDPNTGTWLTAPGKAAKAPSIETFYDEATGQPYNAQWNADAGQWERVGGVKAPTGMSITTNPDGTVSVTQGPTGGGKMTELNSKDMVYATRAAGALPIIDSMGDALISLSESVGGQAPVVGNYMKSPQYQQAEQAGKEFLQAILRKDTGAAITTQEINEYGTVYLPGPGDYPELLAQKKASRQRALQALAAGIPPDLILKLEKSGVELPATSGASGGWTEMPGGIRVRRK